MKKAVLAALLAVSFVSAAVSAAAAQDTFEVGIDRPGSDFAHFAIRSPNQCHDACRGDNRCVAWTFVRPGVQAPEAQCWLKGRVPRAIEYDATISGVIR